MKRSLLVLALILAALTTAPQSAPTAFAADASMRVVATSPLDFTLYGVDRFGFVYFQVQGGLYWTLIPAPVVMNQRSIAVAGDGSIYTVDNLGIVWRWDWSTWTQRPSACLGCPS